MQMSNTLRRLRITLASFAMLWVAVPVAAQQPLETIPLWPGQPPGTESWTGPETTQTLPVPGLVKVQMVGNVTKPTLTVYRPKTGIANGTAVVVIPGGGFQMLAMNHEGELVARWLADRGVTAFVLKYRVRTIPGFAIPGNLRSNPQLFPQFKNSFSSGIPFAVADATQAMRYLRANASRYAIAPDRIGMIGFSAGAITTMGVVMDNAAADRPNFAAPIYGSMEDKAPPKDGPPLFIAVTQDDPAVPAPESLAIFSRWSAAGLPAELHVYERGGHGFGMRPLNQPVDDWTAAFERWMKSHGWLTPPAKK
jgi:acetyl esterase/lipase